MQAEATMEITATLEVMDTRVLILPGIGNSGPGHWQTLWENSFTGCERVQQRDWDNPDCAEWVKRLDKAIHRVKSPPVLVAHSLACEVVAFWAAQHTDSVQGALLVAPPDPESPNFPKHAIGFSPVPHIRLMFPSIVIASSNDPYSNMDFSKRCAMSWGSRFINIGDCGHINALSGLGNWPEGMAQLQSLINQGQGVCV